MKEVQRYKRLLYIERKCERAREFIGFLAKEKPQTKKKNRI